MFAEKSVCRRLGYDESKLCVVVNRYQSGDVLPVNDAEDLLQASVFWKLPNDYRLSAASLTKGIPVALEEPGSKLARGYAERDRGPPLSREEWITKFVNLIVWELRPGLERMIAVQAARTAWPARQSDYPREAAQAWAAQNPAA